MILAGDIGGTNSRLAIFDDKLQERAQRVFKNAGRQSLQEIVREFLSSNGDSIDRACFGVAGPVAGGRVVLTNLNWSLDESALAKELKIARVALINDLVAHAEGIELLAAENIVTLNEGKQVIGGNRAIIAAGTGLGEAGLFWDSKLERYRAFASEGGHCDFAPRSEQEDALLWFLRQRMKNVSWETVLSGPGLRHIYDFLCSPGQFRPTDDLGIADPTPADISNAALQGSSELCVEALNLFVSLYGAEAGNLALKILATGGVYLGGGIAAHMLDFLRRPNFMSSFKQKGPEKLHPLLQEIPVHVITFELNALHGAANYASRL